MKKVICLVWISCFSNILLTSQKIDIFTSQLFDRLFTGQAQPLEIQNLLKAGAQINFKVPDNLQTPLMAALEFNNSLDIIRLLIEHGAEVNVADIYGKTPLFYAAEFNHKLPVVELLVNHGADLEAKSKNNLSIMDYALYYETFSDVVDYLEELNNNIEWKMYTKLNNRKVANWIDDFLKSDQEDLVEPIIPEVLSEEEEKAMEEYDNFLSVNSAINR